MNIFFMSLIGLCVFSGCSDPSSSGVSVETQKTVVSSSVEAEKNISETEKQDLIFLREEEKLAKDVYSFLDEKWGGNVFANITKSEEKHTSAVASLLQKFSIVDPVDGKTAGVFQNPDLQNLYNELTQKGSVSKVEALKVGVFIEEYDIADIDKKIQNTTNIDIKNLYVNLKKGSENHLRAFVKNLKKNGETVSAQILSTEEFERILGNK